MAPSASTICQEYVPINNLTFDLDQINVKGSVVHDNYNRDHGVTGTPDLTRARDGKAVAKAMVQQALMGHIQDLDQDTCEAGDEDTFFVADLGEVYRQHLRWKKSLARVKPHFAVKCNPDPQVLRLLSELGTGFDCASKAEIEEVLRLNVDPTRIIYAQPCKTRSYIRYAASQGVKQMTFDNADELHKIKKFYPEAELFLRISTDDSASLCRLSLKFGASLDSTGGLLALAKDLDLNVTGVAFHVGSGASDPNAFLKAVTDARFVFDQAQALGFDLKTLDVGGGFVGETFESMAEVLSEALDKYFPPHIRVIGEPGRFYVSSAFTIACNVIARRTVDTPDLRAKSYMLYLNDGVYGNFSSIMFDHQHPIAQILKCDNRFPLLLDADQGSIASRKGTHQQLPIEYSIWGPTCDGIDCISSSCTFSEVLDVGDWLFFEEMGAYTRCSATRFNGFPDTHKVIYLSSEPGATALMNKYM